MLKGGASSRLDVAQVFDTSQKEYVLSIVIPTRNEAGNINPLLTGIKQALPNIPVEVLFVDDSSDNTPQIVESEAAHFPDLTIRMIHRTPEQRAGGLGGAVVLGLQNVQADYACVMDGDLQHPPSVIPELLDTAISKQADLVVATRRSQESKVTGLNMARNQISHGLDLLARIFFPRRLRGVSDPLTGFFLVRVKAINLDTLRPNGFKILLEIIIRNPKMKKAEIPFHFGERLAGQSKASAKEAWRYLNLLWALRFGSGSIRFAGFAIVGLSGIAVNSLALYLLTDLLHIYYLVSVVFATLVSTIWNFALTEVWVYRSANQPQGRTRRFTLFFGMNLIALVLRSPLIFVLTSIFGIFYVVSNLVSLVLLTGIRFLTADSFIWSRSSITVPPISEENKMTQTNVKDTYSYNIHNLVTVVSEGELPELEPFRVSKVIDQPTIQVTIGIPTKTPPNGVQESSYLRFHEIFGHLGFEVGITMGDQVKIVANPLMKLSPHVLYTNVVEPILRWTFVKKGYALVHGATISFGKEAYMITARTDTGKTTTLLKILSHQRRNSDKAGFLSDDMTIVSADGIALTYPKPLTISAHTLRAINSDTLTFKEKLSLPLQSRIHSRTGRKVASFISKGNFPAATINMFMQMVIPPPKYSVSKLVPNVKLTKVARFTGMFIIERDGEGIKSIENKEAMEVLLSNCEDAYGFPPYNDLKEFLYFSEGKDLRKKEQEIIRQALGGLPSTLIRSRTLDWWCQIPTFVDEQVANACACDGSRSQSLQAEAIRSMPIE